VASLPDKIDEIDSLLVAVERAAGSTAKNLLKPIHVKELWQGKVAWDGVVEIFEIGPSSLRVYAWERERDDGTLEAVVVLGFPPINSARDAVRASIAADAKNNKHE